MIQSSDGLTGCLQCMVTAKNIGWDLLGDNSGKLQGVKNV
jgi:hypothetical protein